MTEEDDAATRYQRLYQEFIRPRLDRAKRAYDQALTSLWIGNGAAALAVLSFIGAWWPQGSFPSRLLWPLWCFVLGLISMGIGTAAALVAEARAIDSMQRADSVLDFKVDHIKSPAEQAGLTTKDWRTRMAVISAICFILGCVIGLIQLSVRL